MNCVYRFPGIYIHKNLLNQGNVNKCLLSSNLEMIPFFNFKTVGCITFGERLERSVLIKEIKII